MVKLLNKLASSDGLFMQFDYHRVDIVQRTYDTPKKLFLDKKKLFTDKLSLELKKRIMKCLVWSLTLYANETRTLPQADR